MITKELVGIIKNILQNVKEDAIIKYVQVQLDYNISKIPFTTIVSNAIQYALENKEQDKILDAIITKMKKYTIENKQLIYKRVVEKQPLLGLIGGKSVTNQLISGLQSFLTEIEEDKNHLIRKELEQKISAWSEEIKTDPKWHEKFVKIVSNYMDTEATEEYISKIWQYTSSNIAIELANEQNGIRNYLKKSIYNFAEDFDKNIYMITKFNSCELHIIIIIILIYSKELN